MSRIEPSRFIWWSMGMLYGSMTTLASSWSLWWLIGTASILILMVAVRRAEA